MLGQRIVVYCFETKQQETDGRNAFNDNCRGLCVEWSAANGATVVGRGIPRFAAPSREQTADIASLETKEDGTMVLLYKYNDWMMQCRHNFGLARRCSGADFFYSIG